jgi:hypothetical protein
MMGICRILYRSVPPRPGEPVRHDAVHIMTTMAPRAVAVYVIHTVLIWLVCSSSSNSIDHDSSTTTTTSTDHRTSQYSAILVPILYTTILLLDIVVVLPLGFFETIMQLGTHYVKIHLVFWRDRYCTAQDVPGIRLSNRLVLRGGGGVVMALSLY